MDEAAAGPSDHHIIEWEGRNYDFIVVWSQDPCARDGLCDVYNLGSHKIQSNGTHHLPHPTTKSIFIECDAMHSSLFFLTLLPLTTTASNIVLSNDDGWAEINIRALYNALTAAGDSVLLSAPAENESGTGNIQICFFFTPSTIPRKANRVKKPLT